MSRTRVKKAWSDACEECQQLKQFVVGEKITRMLDGCVKCSNSKDGSGFRTRECESCDFYCGEYGNCDSCNISKKCETCKEFKKTSLVILRDCYTLGSPKVGDTAFAETFTKNHKSMQANRPYKPAYWRIANEYDPGNFSVEQNSAKDFFSKCYTDTSLLFLM